MTQGKYATEYTAADQMVISAARQIKDTDTVYVGVGLPMQAGVLAKNFHAPSSTIIIENGIVAVAGKKKERPSFHEKDLQNHISNGLKEPSDPDSPPSVPTVPDPKTDPPAEPAPHGVTSAGGEADALEKDNQLSRALALLKGMSALGKVK